MTLYFHPFCAGLAAASAKQSFWEVKQQHISLVVVQGRANGPASPLLVVSATVY